MATASIAGKTPDRGRQGRATREVRGQRLARDGASGGKRTTAKTSAEVATDWGELLADHPDLARDLGNARGAILNTAEKSIVPRFKKYVAEREEAIDRWEWDTLGYVPDERDEPVETPARIDLSRRQLEAILTGEHDCKSETHLTPGASKELRTMLNRLIGHTVAVLLQRYPWIMRDSPEDFSKSDIVYMLGRSVCQGTWTPRGPARFYSARAIITELKQVARLEADTGGGPPQPLLAVVDVDHVLGSMPHAICVGFFGRPTEESMRAAFEKELTRSISNKLVTRWIRKPGNPKDNRLFLDRYRAYTGWVEIEKAAGRPSTQKLFLEAVSAGPSDGLWAVGHYSSNEKGLQGAKRRFGRKDTSRAFLAANHTNTPPPSDLCLSWIGMENPDEDIPF